MKKAVSLILVFAMTCSLVNVANAENVELIVDDVALSQERCAFEQNGEVYIPMRAVCEQIGYIVMWDNEERCAVAVKEGNEIKVKIGDKTIVRNGVENNMENETIIKDNTTYIPAEALTTFNAQYTLDKTRNSVSVETQANAESNKWIIEYDGNGISRISIKGDKYNMNWAEGDILWGSVTKPTGVNCTIERSFTDKGYFKESYVFTNETDEDIVINEGDLNIATTFNDSYTSSNICIGQRCNTHIWCGDTVTYALALRMGGEAPHLGLFVTKGEFASYSVHRKTGGNVSNNRGDFLLNVKPFTFKANESYAVEWEIFTCKDKEDFKAVLKTYPNYVEVTGDNFVLFEDEESYINDVKVDTSKLGEAKIEIDDTYARVLVQPKFDELLENRVRFICEKQQNKDVNSDLYGAYLIYDNETGEQHFTWDNDHNAARERVGMATVVAQYLQKHYDKDIDDSLKLYEEFLYREIYDKETGMVANNINHDTSYKRYYNFPWVAQFFVEMYYLRNDINYLQMAYDTIMCMYKTHGYKNIYPIGMEIAELYYLLKGENMVDLADELLDNHTILAENVLKTGIYYPQSEVAFEQSIVAPGVNMMLDMYAITKDEKYLNGAKAQLKVLELFNFEQPDYHQHEVAIRHWDGYWFGKNRLLGDTYPHYWSSLTGECYYKYYIATKDEAYRKKAEKSLRGTLSMINADGSATCAYVYPYKVNDTRAQKADPYANDQDWSLYYYVKYGENGNREGLEGTGIIDADLTLNKKIPRLVDRNLTFYGRYGTSVRYVGSEYIKENGSVTLSKRGEGRKNDKLTVIYEAEGETKEKNINVTIEEDNGKTVSKASFDTIDIGKIEKHGFIYFDIIPKTVSDGMVGLCEEEVVPKDWADYPITFRITPQGVFDSRNGGEYTSINSISYEVGLTYHVLMDIDIESQTYSVYITDNRGETTMLAQDFHFRKEASNIGKATVRGGNYVKAGLFEVKNMAKSEYGARVLRMYAGEERAGCDVIALGEVIVYAAFYNANGEMIALEKGEVSEFGLNKMEFDTPKGYESVKMMIRKEDILVPISERMTRNKAKDYGTLISSGQDVSALTFIGAEDGFATYSFILVDNGCKDGGIMLGDGGYLNEESSDYFASGSIVLCFADGKLCVRDGESKKEVAEYAMKEKIKVVIEANTVKNAYDLYVDGNKVADNVHYRRSSNYIDTIALVENGDGNMFEIYNFEVNTDCYKTDEHYTK